MNMKRILSLLLAAVLLLGCLTACGKDSETQEKKEQINKTDADNTVIVKPKYAYKATYIPVTTDNGDALNYVYRFCVCGDAAYYVGNYLTGMETLKDEATGEPIIDETTGEPVEYENYDTGLFRMELASGQVTRLEGYSPREIPEGLEGDSDVRTIMAGPDGTIWTFEETYTYHYDLPENFDSETQNMWDYYVQDKNYQDLVQYSADGEKLQTIELDLGEDFYPSTIYVDSKGYFYVSDWQSCCLLDSAGTLLATISSENGGGDLKQMSTDQIGFVEWGQDGGTSFRPIDPETKALGEAIPLCSNSYNLYPGTGEYQYLYSDNNNFYGYVEGAESGEKLFSWLDCDVDSQYLDQVTFLEDGRVAAIENDWSQEERSCNLLLLEQVDASTLPEKQELTLACMYLDWNLRSKIIQFNRSHDDVRIVVRDYSELIYSGAMGNMAAASSDVSAYDNAVQKLNTEILSGNVPDLIATGDIPMEQYAAKGILMDLWPLIDADGELSREDLMTHLFDCMSIDGKLYSVTDSFSIQTAACKTSITGDRTSWSLSEVLEALESLEPGALIFGETDTKDGILSQCLSFNLDNFIDWQTGTCSFDGPEFVEILNFANTFPKEFDWESYDWETAESEYSRLMSGKQLMSTCYLSDFSEVQVQSAYQGGDVTFIGFPSESGNGSCFMVNSGVSISSTCKNPEAAWSFVRELLLEENQSERDVWGFPSNRHAFEARAKEAMTPEYQIDPATGQPAIDPETGEKIEVSNHGYGIGNDFSIDVYSMKQEEYDALMALYERCSSVYSSDQEIMNIIMEETAPFFDGQKTAEETANLIQNRLSLYISEQM